MKDFIKKLLRESLFDAIPDELFVKAYSNKINEKYDNILIKGSKNDNYSFILGNKLKKITGGTPNKCETNTFNFIKDKLMNGEDYFYPVGGFGFEGKSLWPVEHWWVYDKQNKAFLEVTPLHGEDFRCYAGIINMDIQEDIKKAGNVFDVDFFKGGNVQQRYFKGLVNEVKIKSKESFNSGIEHILFASKNNPNILYKLGREEIINKWTKLFMSNPKLFPRVFKVGKLNSGSRYPAGYYYATVERLNTERVLNEWGEMEMAFDVIADPSSVFIDCLSTEGLFEQYCDKLKDNPRLQKLFIKWMVFISKVTDYVESKGFGGLDIHRGNFAYDAGGNIKCIDV